MGDDRNKQRIRFEHSLGKVHWNIYYAHNGFQSG